MLQVVRTQLVYDKVSTKQLKLLLKPLHENSQKVENKNEIAQVGAISAADEENWTRYISEAMEK